MDKFMEWLNIILWVVTPVSSIVLCIAADARKLKIWFESVVITLLCAFGVAFMLSQKTPDNCYVGCSQSFFVPFIAWCCLIGFSILLAMFQFSTADTSKSDLSKGNYHRAEDLTPKQVAELMGQGGPTFQVVKGTVYVPNTHEDARYGEHIARFGVNNAWGNSENDIKIEYEPGDYTDGRLSFGDLPREGKPSKRN